MIWPIGVPTGRLTSILIADVSTKFTCFSKHDVTRTGLAIFLPYHPAVFSTGENAPAVPDHKRPMTPLLLALQLDDLREFRTGTS
jgi:hypothetical protein